LDLDHSWRLHHRRRLVARLQSALSPRGARDYFAKATWLFNNAIAVLKSALSNASPLSEMAIRQSPTTMVPDKMTLYWSGLVSLPTKDASVNLANELTPFLESSEIGSTFFEFDLALQSRRVLHERQMQMDALVFRINADIGGIKLVGLRFFNFPTGGIFDANMLRLGQTDRFKLVLGARPRRRPEQDQKRSNNFHGTIFGVNGEAEVHNQF
jgi:hypothetical protein